jgi:putative flippase GtrA
MPPTQQFLLFCAVGVSTTLVDFAIFNLLTRPAMGWRRIPANVVSVAVAMGWSFLANWVVVFNPGGHEWIERAGRFLLVTVFSAFVLQNFVLYVTTYVWRSPTELVLAVVRRFGLRRFLTDDAWARNTCKVLAVTTGLVWNFLWYKLWVYAP